MKPPRFPAGFWYYVTYPFKVTWWIASGCFAVVVLWVWEKIEKKGKP